MLPNLYPSFFWGGADQLFIVSISKEDAPSQNQHKTNPPSVTQPQQLLGRIHSDHLSTEMPAGLPKASEDFRQHDIQ